MRKMITGEESNVYEKTLVTRLKAFLLILIETQLQYHKADAFIAEANLALILDVNFSYNLYTESFIKHIECCKLEWFTQTITFDKSNEDDEHFKVKIRPTLTSCNCLLNMKNMQGISPKSFELYPLKAVTRCY